MEDQMISEGYSPESPGPAEILAQKGKLTPSAFWTLALAVLIIMEFLIVVIILANKNSQLKTLESKKSDLQITLSGNLSKTDARTKELVSSISAIDSAINSQKDYAPLFALLDRATVKESRYSVVDVVSGEIKLEGESKSYFSIGKLLASLAREKSNGLSALALSSTSAGSSDKKFSISFKWSPSVKPAATGEGQ